MADRSVAVRLRLVVSDYISNAANAAKATRSIKQEIDDLGKKSPGQVNDIALAMGGMGAALAGVAGYAVKAAMDFDKQMSAVSAATKANASQMESLRKAALDAGQATVFSATEAAAAQTELAKAGLTTSQILGGGLKGALDLAAAGTMDVGDAAEIAATAMTQFGLSGAQIPHVADLLAAGAGKAQGEVADMGMALKQSGLVANQFGVSIEETTGTLAAFASAGLIGSDAGTSFKTMLLMLANPSKEAATTMERLGISAYDAQGKFVGIRDLAGQLQTKLSGLTEEQRNAALATIFGSDAIRAAGVLYKQGAGGVEDWTNKVNDSGFAADQARRKTDNLAGDIERLKGSIESASIAAGSGANGGLRLLVQSLDGLVGAFASLPSPVQTALVVLTGVGGAGLVATAGLLKVRQTAQEALTALSEMGPAGSRAADGLGRVGKIAGQATAWGVAIFGAYEGIKLFVNFLNSDVKGATRNVDEMSRSMLELGKSGQVVGELRNAFGGDLRRLTEGHTQFVKTQREMSTALHESGNALDELGRAIAANNAEQAGLNDKQRKKNNDFIESITAVDKALTNVVAKGGTTQAKLAYEELADTWVRSGKPLSELNALLPNYNKAIGDAAAATGGAAAGFGTAEQNARTMAGSLNEAMRAGQSLKQVFDQLNGGQINLTQAQINAEAAVDGLTEALVKSEGQLDLNTEAGRAASQAALDLATKGRDLAQATFDQSGSAEQARGVFEQYRQQLINNIATAGGTKQATDASRLAAENLANQIMQMPAFKKIDISVPGIDPAIEKILALKSGLNDLKDRTVTVTTIQNTQTGQTRTSVHQSQRFEADGGVLEFYAGGGMRENHIAQIARAGTWRVWAEPETEGEAYIPMAMAKRGRSLQVLAEVNRRFGNPLGGDGVSMTSPRGDVTVVVNPPAGASTEEIVAQVKRELAWEMN